MKYKTFFSFSMLDKQDRPYLNTSAAIEYSGKSKSRVKSSDLLQLILNRAAITGDLETIKYLKDNGAMQIEKLKFQEPLILAIENEQENAAIFLIECGGKAILRYVDEESKNNLLHKAAFRGQAKTCASLLKNNPDLNIDAKNKDKSTALHCAVASGNIETVRVLLDAGATIKIKNDHKNTALSLAKMHDNQEIVTYLENYGHHEETEKQPNLDPLAPPTTSRISRIE